MENISLSLQIQQPTQQTILNGNNPPPPQPPYTVMLHTVYKPPAKPWKRLERPPPKVYHVDPRGFRKLVQKLTAAPKRMVQSSTSNPNPRPLRDTLGPPPPLDLVPRALPPVQASEHNCSGVQTNKLAMTQKSSVDTKSLMGMFSPSLHSPYAWWCSFPLLSPGTMASPELSNSPVL